MTSFKKFIIKLTHVKLNLQYTNGEKDKSSLVSQLVDISSKKLDGNNWYELDRSDSRIKTHNQKYSEYNTMFIGLNKKYCVIDTDGEREYDVIMDYFQNICDYIMVQNNVNKSCSNYEVKDTNYKKHFWFELDGEYDNLTNILGSKYNLKFDILFDKIFEHTSNYYITDFKPLSIGLEEINELLCYIDTKFNTQFILSPVIKNNLETINKDINELYEYIECLDNTRYGYNNWRNVGFALHSAIDEYNENELLDLFNHWSSRDKYGYKGLNSIIIFWNSIKTISDGITLKSFYKWCKEDNPSLYNNLTAKFTCTISKIDINIWQILEDMNHSDMAKLYYKLNSNKYIYSTTLGWFEYNNNNILIPYNKTIPSSLLSDTTNKLQNYIIQERNKLVPPTKGTDCEIEYERKMKYYDKCMKLAKKGYINVGSSSYVKNIIDYLSNLYNIDRLDTLLDANVNLLAFDDKVFDYQLGTFRNIDSMDYITKTTKYKCPIKSNTSFDYINKLLYSIFEKDDIVEYWLVTTGLSLFGNKLESLYIHTGSGGNGKGLLSSILVKALGDYMYCADNTFLTSVFKSGQANPTLAKCQSIRYLLVSEPDDGSDDVKFNVDFIKMLTGGDIITTRDLFKSNISYKPQFTPFVQCNNKPKLGKIDDGIKRRVKIINYPLKFVDKPTKNNERPIDYTLKDKLNDELYKQFILLLIDKAVEYKNKKIIQPNDVQNETNEYFDENDPVKGWLATNCIITNNDKDRIKTSELYNSFISTTGIKLSMVKFSDYVKQNCIETLNKMGYKYFIGIKISNIEL